MVKMRDSRIELLRIVLMWTVMAQHFVVHNAGSVSVFPDSFTRFFYNIFFYPIGRTAVGCFVAITIWFVAGKVEYSINKAVKQIASIEGTVLFYSIALGFFFMLRGDIQVSPTNLIDIFAPTLTGSSWWFVTVYAWLVFLLPFILPALHALGQKLHRYLGVFLVSVFGFLRYVPLFWIPIDGLLVDFIIICVVVCYIRWYVDLSIVDMRLLVACCIASFVGVAISFYGQFHFDGLLGSTFANLYSGFFGSPASIFSLAIAVSVLLVDLKMPHFSSRFINAVARLCFATYLISDYAPIRSWLWSSLFPFTRVGVGLGLLQVLLVPTAVFAICLMLEGLRRLLVSFIMRFIGPFDLLNKASN